MPAEDSWMMCKYLPNELGSVLEIGCGSGIISIHLAKKGNQVTSVDINPKAVNATKSHNIRTRRLCHRNNWQEPRCHAAWRRQ